MPTVDGDVAYLRLFTARLIDKEGNLLPEIFSPPGKAGSKWREIPTLALPDRVSQPALEPALLAKVISHLLNAYAAVLLWFAAWAVADFRHGKLR